jgi:hypothetical protein
VTASVSCYWPHRWLRGQTGQLWLLAARTRVLTILLGLMLVLLTLVLRWLPLHWGRSSRLAR